MRNIVSTLAKLTIALILLIIFPINQVLADGTYAAINTSYGNDSGPDALNFSQGKVWTIDKYGKYVWMTENRSGVHAWAFSNNTGGTWIQGTETYNFLTRGSVAYDSINDKLHVIWTTDACDASGGIIYRRYGITRDVSNNITDIVREDATNVNLQLDITGSITCQQPVALWVNDGSANGILVAIWSKAGTGQNEVRASMRRLSLSAADGVAGNWVAVDGTASTFATNAPAVAANKVFGSATTTNNAASAMVRGGNGSRKNDLYIFVQETANSRVSAYRAVWNASASNWSGGFQAPVTLGQFSSAGGYSLKYQLLTRPVLDTTNDRLYLGWGRWKDSTSGDTVSIAYLDSTDTPSSTIDVYSALGTHSFAPTIDIAFDSTRSELYVAYIESTTNGTNGSIDYKVYDGSSLGAQVRYYTSPGGTGGADGSGDIPVLFESRSNDRLLFAFRINGAIPPTAINPHKIDFGYITMPAATTPTPTPASSPSSSSSTSNVSSASVCGDSTPGKKAPWLYGAIAQDSHSILLYFTEADNPVSKYILEYGTKSGSYQYGVQNMGVNIRGQMTFLVQSLFSNNTYYFRIQGGNGCAAGPWSNEISAKTSSTATNNSPVVSSEIASSHNSNNSEPTPTKIESQSNPGTYDLTITALDAKNKPLPHIKVTVHSQEQTAFTDANGKATFAKLESGKHQVMIAYNNQIDNETVYLGGNSASVNLTVNFKPETNYVNIFLGAAGGIILAVIALILYRVLGRKFLKK